MSEVFSISISESGILFASAITVGAGMFFFVLRRVRRQATDTATLHESIRQELHIAPTLHPVIDPNRCIGSLSCIKVCPEGDILGVVNGKAALITAANCIGHGQCALECPVDAIRLVFGSSERGVDLPEVSEFFESSRAGVHIVGELGGMGLIKNAVRQGVQVVEHLKKMKRPASSDPKVADLAIVGAGPAGMAASLAAREAGLSFHLLDQEPTFGGNIANFPRQKVVMTEKVQLPLVGWIGKTVISKEELLELWKRALSHARVRLHNGVKVGEILGHDGDFQVQTNKGVVRARKVILAIGRMGAPRKMGVPGEELAKVTYRLIDPEQYNGKQILVVGGGDSALESAIMLAEQSTAKVGIAYRGPAFGRCRPANREAIDRLIQNGKVKALMNTVMKEVTPKTVIVERDSQRQELPNDFIFVHIGGELPTEYLKKLGISIQRHFGATAASKPRRTVSLDLSRVSRVTHEVLDDDRERRRLAFLLTIVGTAIVGYLAYVGRFYYLLPIQERVRSPLHAALRPGGVWGHGVGIVATFVMLSNFLYAARKNFRWLKGRRSIRSWLTFHMFVGLMSPIVILFHAAFQSNNLVATLTYVSVLFVVGSGLIGRFIYGMVPTAGGRALEAAELRGRIEQLASSINPYLEKMGRPELIHPLMQFVLGPGAAAKPMMNTIAAMPAEQVHVRRMVHALRPYFAKRSDYADFRALVLRLVKMKRQAAFHLRMKGFLGWWRMIHVVLAIFLVAVIAVHIYISIRLGYRWIF